MADITMCNNEKCKKAKSCYRFMANANPYLQSYLIEPKNNCESRDYEMYIEVVNSKGNGVKNK